ncbi:MAG: aminopeptidase P family protein [Deltaproteobacteria bacterium]|nr:aminopeptidase P family protein [Deltaproteobacteria bacterium]
MTIEKAPQPQGYQVFGPKPHLADVPYEEHNARINKAKSLMRQQGIDLLMLWSEQNCHYFGGFTSTHWNAPSIQPCVTIIPVDGEPVIMVPEFFRWVAEAQCWIRDIRGQIDAHQTNSERDLPREVAEVVKEMGYGNANIGLEMGELAHTWIPRPYNDIKLLLDSLPDANFVAGDMIVWGCRMLKSPLEMERLIKAAAIHRQAFGAIVDEYRPGMTENDVLKIFMVTAAQNGAEWLQSGHIMCGDMKEGIVDCGGHWDGIVINKGDYISVDMCLKHKGYCADMGRFIYVGPTPDDYKRGTELMWDAFDAAVDKIKPGVPANEVYNALIKVEQDGGMWPIEMAGHGIGLDIHEPPVFSATEETLLEAGMCMEVECCGLIGGFHKEGHTGMFHYENLIIVTDDGCQVIEGLPRKHLEVSCYK